MNVTIWHNPRCSKSRETLELLQKHGLDPTVRHYLVDTPTGTEIRHARKTLGRPLIDMMRTGDRIFKDLGLSADSDDALLIAAMGTHPILIQRPIVFVGDKAAIGRPPSAVLEIL